MNLSENLRVVVVEAHPLVRAAIRQILSVPGIEVVGEARDADSALELIQTVKPDVMLVDLDLPGMNGVLLVRELAPRLPDTKIIMLAASGKTDDVVAAIRGGAAGYLTKDISADALVRSVLGIRRGDLPMSRRLAAELVSCLVGSSGRRETGDLSDRELQVLGLVADGLTDHELGETLGISPRTVGRHVSNILDKLGVRNRAEAARHYRDEL